MTVARRALPAGLVLAALVFAAAPAAAQSLRGMRREFSDIGERVIPATVIVRSPGAPAGYPGSSGVIVHSSGYVLSDADATLERMVRDKDGQVSKIHGRTAVIRLPAPDHRALEAVLVHRDPETDSSLLKIVDPPRDLPFVPVGRSDGLRVGAFLIVTGNTFGTGQEAEPSLTMGVVGALPPRAADGQGRYETIYTSAAVVQGSNGGPAVDLTGRVVGIVSTFVGDPTSPYRALGQVTPIERIRTRMAAADGAAEALAPPDDRADVPRESAIVEAAFAAVARRAAPSIVSIEVNRAPDARTVTTILAGGRPVAVPRYGGPYSGIVLDPAGLVVTSSANLWEFPKITAIRVHLADGRTLPATVKARDRFRGVALLEVDADDLVPLPPAAPGDLEVGRFALALGNPFGAARQAAPLLTFGLVSNLHRVSPLLDAIQTDAGMNDAMVGGALVTVEGKLLGISILVQPETFGRNSGIGFAIPMSTLAEVLPRLRKGENVEPGYIGIRLEAEGLVVADVTAGGPAANAGLKKGDVILHAGGKPAKDLAGPAGFGELVREHAPGTKFPVTVKRGETMLSLDVILGSWPED